MWKPISTLDIAKATGERMQLLYQGFYRTLSQSVHSSSLRLSGAVRFEEDGENWIGPMIDKAIVPSAINNASGCVIESLVALNSFYQVLTPPEHQKLGDLVRELSANGE